MNAEPNIIELPPQAELVELTDLAQLEALKLAAASDGHTAIVPTHLVMKRGEIVGYASIGAVPVLNVWVHSQKVVKFESVRLLRQGEALLKERGYQFVILPVAENSPFRPYVQKLGYHTLGNASYNIKQL